LATVAFNTYESRHPSLATFDARAFVLPNDEVANYFVWRQKDAERNSLSMLAQAHFSQKQLQGKNRAAMHEMLHEKGVNWNDVKTVHKRGAAARKSRDWAWDTDIPVFTKDRAYIEAELPGLRKGVLV
jgi:tRNA(His) 5'-end guanylyltransferase